MSRLSPCAPSAFVVWVAGLGVLLAFAHLSGCATATPHLAAASDVRIIYSERFIEEEPDPRRPPPQIPDAEFVDGTQVVHGALLEEQSFESRVKDYVAGKDADIALVRPSAPYRGIIKTTRVEAWRTRGYLRASTDEPAQPGITLVPPADTTISKRKLNIAECYAEARVDPLRALPASEKAPLGGYDTRGFIRNGRPYVDKYARPTKSGSISLVVPNIGLASTDVYVLCLIKRGYQWPRS